MAKLNIDFVLLDESVVMHGFRALMTGAELDGFIQNPVLLLMHNRSSSYASNSDMPLPIGRWYDIRVEGKRLLAKPDFDDSDELAMKVQKKVEGGYMNGASVWIEPITLSEEEADMLPGQRLPTFTKWGLLEASIVDIPNCRNSLAIRNSAGKRITLSGNSEDTDLQEYLQTILQKEKNQMDKKLLCAKLGLAESATDEQISEKLTAVLGNSASLESVSAENKTLKDQVIKLTGEAAEKKISDLVDSAIAAKKITEKERETYTKLAASNYDATKDALDAMSAYESIESKLSAGQQSDAQKLELEGLMKLSGRELYVQGKLDQLKSLSVDGFKLKYQEAFGIEFKA